LCATVVHDRTCPRAPGGAAGPRLRVADARPAGAVAGRSHAVTTTTRSETRPVQDASTCLRLPDIGTPAALVDEARMTRNIARMQERMQALGVRPRPHVKTPKSIEGARRQR